MRTLKAILSAPPQNLITPRPMRTPLLRLSVLLPGLSVLLLGLPAGDAFAQGDADTGARLYKDFGCYQCHQYSGAGYQGAPGGAALVPLRFPLEAFIAYIRNPSTPTRMPPYTEKVLSREQAEHIHAFIVNLPQPRPKEDIELLGSIIEEIEAVE